MFSYLALYFSVFLSLSPIQPIHTTLIGQINGTGPADKPINAQTQADYDRMQKAVIPYIAQARRTYPKARERFLKGLPSDQRFFVTTIITDKNKKKEQVFIYVRSIEKGKINGAIASQIMTVEGYHERMNYSFNERDLIDWTISHRDGTEEGNFVGKFLDNYHP